MEMEGEALVADHPVASTLLVAAVATIVYAGLQLVLDSAVDPVETAIFVLVFTVVYVGGTWFLRRRRADAEGETAGESTPDATVAARGDGQTDAGTDGDE